MKRVLCPVEIRDILLGEESAFLRHEIKFLPAATAEEMLDMHRLKRADLIIVTLVLPDMAGDRFLAALRREQSLKDVGLIIICPPDPRTMARCRDSGANAVLSEPVDRVELLRQVVALLNVARRGSMREMIRATVAGSSGQEHFYGVALNISVSGMLMETDRIMNPGDRISCSFVIDQPVTVAAEVVRVSKEGARLFRYGVKFTGLAPAVQAEIGRLVRDLRQRAGE